MKNLQYAKIEIESIKIQFSSQKTFHVCQSVTFLLIRPYLDFHTIMAFYELVE